MNDTTINLENNGWHLIYHPDHDKLGIPDTKMFDSVWTFPVNSQEDSEMIAGEGKDHSLIFSDNFYWYHIFDKTEDHKTTPATPSKSGNNF